MPPTNAVLTVSSRIDAVQVYRRGATVVRTAVVDDPGEDVEIVDLPLSLLDPTVKVRVLAAEGGGEVVAAGVRVGLWVRPGGEPPKAPEQKELDDVRRKLRRLREQADQIEGEVSLLS